MKTQTSRQLFSITLLTVLLSLPFLAIAKGAIDWSPKTFQQLDYGIYWFKYNPKGRDQVIKAIADASKEKGYFNPKAPTLIYFHGYVPGSTQKRQREDFSFTDPNTNKTYDTLRAWKQKGWNVGVFYWNQFSDDKHLFRTQSKLYSARFMYWAYLGKDGKTHTIKAKTPKLSVTQLAVKNYKMVMSQYQGNQVRVVGHSLGGQLAIQFSALLHQDILQGLVKPRLMPKRLALLDPVFAPTSTPYPPYGISTAKLNYYDLVKLLDRNTPYNIESFAVYRSSAFSLDTSAYTHDIDRLAALTFYKPKYLPPSYYLKKHGVIKGIFEYNLAQHNASRFIYFGSMGYPPPPDYQSNSWNSNAPSAASSKNTIEKHMGSGYKSVQISGLKVFNPGKDAFQLKHQR